MNVARELDIILNKLRDLRDEQDEIPCFFNEESCICNKFDQIIDLIEKLTKEFEKHV